MPEQHKPLIIYRRGWINYRIVPRNAKGWRYLLAWWATILPIAGLAIGFASRYPDGPALYVGLVMFLIVMGFWAIGGIIWLRARSEVLDVEEFLSFKRESERKRRRGT